jgi:hypothetical protein
MLYIHLVLRSKTEWSLMTLPSVHMCGESVMCCTDSGTPVESNSVIYVVASLPSS